jgi:hypothetical protein
MTSSLCKILVVMQEWKCIRAGHGHWKVGGSENVPKGIGYQLISLAHLVWCEDQ